MKFGFFTQSNVLRFPKNNFHNLPKTVTQLQKELEIADAQKFKNSVAALINNKTPTHRPSLGLFAAPKPKLKSNAFIMEHKNKFDL